MSYLSAGKLITFIWLLSTVIFCMYVSSKKIVCKAKLHWSHLFGISPLCFPILFKRRGKTALVTFVELFCTRCHCGFHTVFTLTDLFENWGRQFPCLNGRGEVLCLFVTVTVADRFWFMLIDGWQFRKILTYFWAVRPTIQNRYSEDSASTFLTILALQGS